MSACNGLAYNRAVCGNSIKISHFVIGQSVILCLPCLDVLVYLFRGEVFEGEVAEVRRIW